MTDNNALSIKEVLSDKSVKQRFYDMLGNKAESFIVSVINVVSNDRLLANADKNSILFAAATAATLDLPINASLGFAYIVPFRDKHTNTIKAQFQMGYKGFIQLAQRTGLFKTISASPIYEGQLVSENPLTGYEFDFSVKSDKIIGYAGYFELTSGFNKTLYLSIDELKKHGTKYSQSYKKGYGLWVDNFDSMATKTVIKLLLSRFAPLSVEMQRAVMLDQGVVMDWEGEVVQYPDNKPSIESPEEVSISKEKQRVMDHIKKSKTIEELQEAEAFSTDLPEDDKVHKAYKKKLEELSTEADDLFLNSEINEK